MTPITPIYACILITRFTRLQVRLNTRTWIVCRKDSPLIKECASYHVTEIQITFLFHMFYSAEHNPQMQTSYMPQTKKWMFERLKRNNHLVLLFMLGQTLHFLLQHLQHLLQSQKFFFYYHIFLSALRQTFNDHIHIHLDHFPWFLQTYNIKAFHLNISLL